MQLKTTAAAYYVVLPRARGVVKSKTPTLMSVLPAVRLQADNNILPSVEQNKVPMHLIYDRSIR
jgi:hypothetical protein